jgi:hypothetical protein
MRRTVELEELMDRVFDFFIMYLTNIFQLINTYIHILAKITALSQISQKMKKNNNR